MPSRKSSILVVDDDPRIVKLLKGDLELEGYRVITATGGRMALQFINDDEPDLIILDIMMPEMDGLEVCRYVRQSSQVPIIMLTAKAQLADVTHGLEIGADDYIVKPFSVDVLLARVKAVLRRTKSPEEIPQASLTSGELHIDVAQHTVRLAGEEVKLTPTEYKLLYLLARNPGKLISMDRLLTEVWGWQYHGENHLLQVAINRLRKKIKDNPHSPRYIATRSGIGYIFLQSSSPGS
ncbi:MAG: response regulator transcription factor [Chloroflexi bacterium]|nr:response regulator transcription factor [Chloroflexota bacterium]